ncbi:hypothetical protein ElyMa_002456200 [Elysia marginata]|uniref:Uncharacterized protein n=1 Tax=Elysia marginata TaxID=1093978 RepID=A0AAV4GM96_9GAST|nr:hypothetical protein ElyMa_002456200 [Elysia marginata]
MPGKKTCPLCLEEKLAILRKRGSLNVRKEIFSHCAHRRKFWLSNAPQPANTDQFSHLMRAELPETLKLSSDEKLYKFGEKHATSGTIVDNAPKTCAKLVTLASRAAQFR